jgi:hypothetical protein
MLADDLGQGQPLQARRDGGSCSAEREAALVN